MKFTYYAEIMKVNEDKSFIQRLDELGSGGWELVQIVNDVAIFKQPILYETNRKLLVEDSYNHHD